MRVLGWLMIAAPFVGFFAWTFVDSGGEALKFWGIVFSVVVWTGVGWWLVIR